MWLKGAESYRKINDTKQCTCILNEAHGDMMCIVIMYNVTAGLTHKRTVHSPSRIRVSEFEQLHDSLFSQRGGGSEIGLSTRVESILNENTRLTT